MGGMSSPGGPVRSASFSLRQGAEMINPDEVEAEAAPGWISDTTRAATVATSADCPLILTIQCGTP